MIETLLGKMGYIKKSKAKATRLKHVLDALERHQANLSLLIETGRRRRRIVEQACEMAKVVMDRRLAVEKQIREV